MENIERLIANNDTWCSPPFYSHLGGYKMHLRVEPEFLVYINISVSLMKGEFDDDLSWPLEGTLTLEQPLERKVELRASKPKEGEILGFCVFLHRAPDLTLCVSEVSVKLRICYIALVKNIYMMTCTDQYYCACAGECDIPAV